MRDDQPPDGGDHQRVYVLRLWEEEGPPHSHRISLYHALSGVRLYFSSLEALLQHLSTQLGPDDEGPEAPHLQS